MKTTIQLISCILLVGLLSACQPKPPTYHGHQKFCYYVPACMDSRQCNRCCYDPLQGDCIAKYAAKAQPAVQKCRESYISKHPEMSPKMPASFKKCLSTIH